MEFEWITRPTWLVAAGIVWDLSGAFALSKGWLFASDERIKRQSGSYYGSNPATSRAYAEQRLESQLGFKHLIVGFTLQLAASLGLTLPFSIAIWTLVPLCVHWLFFVAEYRERIIADGVGASISKESAESTWRAHYEDMSDLEWRRALVNAGIEFRHKVPPET